MKFTENAVVKNLFRLIIENELKSILNDLLELKKIYFHEF